MDRCANERVGAESLAAEFDIHSLLYTLSTHSKLFTPYAALALDTVFRTVHITASFRIATLYLTMQAHLRQYLWPEE